MPDKAWKKIRSNPVNNFIELNGFKLSIYKNQCKAMKFP
jgi:hypothetical protein